LDFLPLGDFAEFFYGFVDRVMNDIALDAHLLGHGIRGLAVEVDQLENQVGAGRDFRMEGGKHRSQEGAVEDLPAAGGCLDSARRMNSPSRYSCNHTNGPTERRIHSPSCPTRRRRQ